MPVIGATKSIVNQVEPPPVSDLGANVINEFFVGNSDSRNSDNIFKAPYSQIAGLGCEILA